jgi:hypothetical protein
MGSADNMYCLWTLHRQLLRSAPLSQRQQWASEIFVLHEVLWKRYSSKDYHFENGARAQGKLAVWNNKFAPATLSQGNEDSASSRTKTSDVRGND